MVKGGGTAALVLREQESASRTPQKRLDTADDAAMAWRCFCACITRTSCSRI